MRGQMIRCLVLASAALLGGTAAAQEVALPEPVSSSPSTSSPEEPEISIDSDREIDLANVVTSAAKSVTTVQEAPAIITIITAEDIRRRGYKWLNEALSIVPGWIETAAIGGQLQHMLARGTQQSVLLLHDGISLFDHAYNTINMQRTLPLENIKRIEVVTGPGGVLWGANSFLGIVNIISKDADDVNGFEVSAGYGDGPGNRQHFKAYGLFGKSFWKGRLKIFQHISYETYLGRTYDIPQFIASTPAPQPVGPAYFGENSNFDPQRSWMVTIDGKYSLGPVSLYYNVPVGEAFVPMTFGNATSPSSRWTMIDRYVILEYKDRFWKDRFGINAKGYWTQIVRGYWPHLFVPSSTFPPHTEPGGEHNVGGLSFDFRNAFNQRVGGTLDMDLNLKYGIRLLFGGEFFHESTTNSVVSFPHPGPASYLPLYCPLTQQADGSYTPVYRCPRQFVTDSERYVAALYANAQYKPIRQLTFDGGVRIQKGFGQLPYDLQPLYSAAVVWNFLPDWHLKGTYATGFRPPVYINISGAPGGLIYGGDPTLKSESSQSFQTEINARLLRNTRKVRELELRVDYAYTFLDRLLQISGGSYHNRGQRAIHSVEAYAKLYLQGDHFLQASYTFMHTTSSDAGVIRAMPNHWVSLGAVFNVVKNYLDLNTNLLITGAYEDPNRYPSVGQAGALPPCIDPATGMPLPKQQCAIGTSVAFTTDLTIDRITPVAMLQLGFRLRFFKERLSISGQFYNVLNQRIYSTDAFYDLTPSVELTPGVLPGFNFFTSVTYRY